MSDQNLFYQQLEEQNDADYVKVVRCKDCQFYTTINYIKGKFCIKHSHLGDDFVFHCDEDDFCSWGKRR